MPMSRLAAGWQQRAGALALGGVATVAACWAVVTSSGFGGGGSQELLQLEGNVRGLPMMSSACIVGMDHCDIAVPGGSLKLTNIAFPSKQTPGYADAVGYVNGKFMSGHIRLDARPEDQKYYLPGLQVEKKTENLRQMGKVKHATHAAPAFKHKQIRPRQSLSQKPKPAAESAGPHGDELADQQYEIALKAIEGHIEERQQKVEAEAKKIAAAVAKTITSPEVSKKIADLAMDAAAQSAGPMEASETGAIANGVSGVGQDGYSDEPAGTQGPGCGKGCAEDSATTPDLDTVAAPHGPLRPSPPSMAYYDAWKGTGSQVGQFLAPPAPGTTIDVQNPPQVFAAPGQLIPGTPAVQVEPLDSLPEDVEEKIDAMDDTEPASASTEPASASKKKMGASKAGDSSSLIAQMQSLAEQVKAAGNLPQPGQGNLGLGGNAAGQQESFNSQMTALNSQMRSTRKARNLPNPWAAFSRYQEGS